MNDSKFDPETQKAIDWVESEVQKGLVDLKFTRIGCGHSNMEKFSKEFNEMRASPIVNDPESNIL